jgi:hypothetical protein
MYTTRRQRYTVRSQPADSSCIVPGHLRDRGTDGGEGGVDPIRMAERRFASGSGRRGQISVCLRGKAPSARHTPDYHVEKKPRSAFKNASTDCTPAESAALSRSRFPRESRLGHASHTSRYIYELPVKNPGRPLTARERTLLAQERLARVIGRHTVATSRTLEQKISDAGPRWQHIDPHRLTPVRQRMVEAGELSEQQAASAPWYSLPDTDPAALQQRMAEQIPIFQRFGEQAVSMRSARRSKMRCSGRCISKPPSILWAASSISPTMTTARCIPKRSRRRC